jgi:hypothetical protein
LFFATSSIHASVNVTLGAGSSDPTNANFWSTNNDVFGSNNPTGLAFNWESINTDTASLVDDNWQTTWDTTSNYVIGRGYFFRPFFDLSVTQDGFTDLDITAQISSTNFTNWRMIMLVDNVLYQLNQTGNYFNGSNSMTFQDLESGNSWRSIATNPNSGVSNFDIDDTIGSTMPNLQANTGLVQFGFMQLGESSSSSIRNQPAFTTSVNQFQVNIQYTEPVPEPATCGLILAGASLLIVMLRNRSLERDR